MNVRHSEGVDMDKCYSREIHVSSSPAIAFQALTVGFDKWWTTGADSIAKKGDEIVFQFGPSYWVMRAIQLIPNRLVELECIEAHHVHEGLPSSILNEWKGTSLKWEISENAEHTKIAFIHEGLFPSLHCFEVCEQGWDYYFVNSLKAYLSTGKGSPFEHQA